MPPVVSRLTIACLLTSDNLVTVISLDTTLLESPLMTNDHVIFGSNISLLAVRVIPEVTSPTPIYVFVAAEAII